MTRNNRIMNLIIINSYSEISCNEAYIKFSKSTLDKRFYVKNFDLHLHVIDMKEKKKKIYTTEKLTSFYAQTSKFYSSG